MENVKTKVEGDLLTVEIDLRRGGGRSGSGKTTRVASTEGNLAVPGAEHIVIGLNCYTK